MSILLACDNADSCAEGAQHPYPEGFVQFVKADAFRKVATDAVTWIGGGTRGVVTATLPSSHEVLVEVGGVEFVIPIECVQEA